jgi:hypothetical protein
MRLRAVARQIKEHSRTTYQRWMLRQHLAAFDRIVLAGRRPPQRLLEHLIHAWGNEAWSADTELLQTVLDWFPKTSGFVLECGSGLSTLLLASLASAHGRQVRSLEHDAGWAARVNDVLTRRSASNLEVILAPMQRYADFDWYSMAVVNSLSPVGFVLCDGPPGSTRGGRYGLAPVLKDNLAPGCIVLLDDSHRPEERSIIKRWCQELAATVVDQRTTCSALRIRGAFDADHIYRRTGGNGAG